MCLNVRKRTFGYEHPVKAHISLCIQAVRSNSLLGEFWVAKDARFLLEDTENYDQRVRMRKLI